MGQSGNVGFVTRVSPERNLTLCAIFQSENPVSAGNWLMSSSDPLHRGSP